MRFFVRMADASFFPLPLILTTATAAIKSTTEAAPAMPTMAATFDDPAGSVPFAAAYPPALVVVGSG